MKNKITIEITTGDDAFFQNYEYELKRILNKCAETITETAGSGYVYDTNGVSVCKWTRK